MSRGGQHSTLAVEEDVKYKAHAIHIIIGLIDVFSYNPRFGMLMYKFAPTSFSAAPHLFLCILTLVARDAIAYL
jgi:hypothetical protein